MYRSIQIGRAIAALLVACSHLAETLAKNKYFGAASSLVDHIFLPGGAAGVAFFFVLSGFIIVKVHRADFGQPRRLLPYLRKRIVRIYPIYLVVFVVVFLVALATPSLRNSVPHGAWVIVKSLLLVPQDKTVVGGTGAPVVLVAWTLQYELIFYGAIALAILHRALLAGAVLAFAVYFTWHTVSGSHGFPGDFFATHLMLLFGLGAIAAVVVENRRRLHRPLMWAAIAATLFILVYVAEAVWRDSGPRVLYDFGYGVSASALVVALVHAEDLQPERFRTRLFALLGESSYALYLVHFPLISLLAKLAVGAGLSGFAGATVSFVVILAACVVVSTLVHLWVERPLLRVLSPHRVHREPLRA